MEDSVNNDVEQQEYDAQAEADFKAGFTGEDPAKTDDVEKPASVAVESESQDTAQVADAEPAKSVMAVLTEDHIKTLLAKASKVDALEQELISTRDRLFGRYGEVQRTLQEMKQAQAPSNGGAKLPAINLKRLSAEYPEIAEILAEDLSSAFPASTATEAPSIDDVMNAVDKRIELRAMNAMRKDWRDVIKTDDFTLFKSQLPVAEQEQFEDSWDANYINDVITKYDAWKEGATKQASASTQKTTEKQNRLERAIQPRGTTTTNRSLSEEDEFEAGFKSVRGNRT